MNLGSNTPPHILSGWKDIANYLGKGVRTVQRYEEALRLPVRRPAGRVRGSVVATTTELDAWVIASPIREEFQGGLFIDAQCVTSGIAVRQGIRQMRTLQEQMRTLRAEMRQSMFLLHKRIETLRSAVPKDDHDCASICDLLNRSNGNNVLLDIVGDLSLLKAN